MAVEMIIPRHVERDRLIRELESAAAQVAALPPAEIAALMIRAAQHLRQGAGLAEKMRLYVSQRLLEIDGQDEKDRSN